MHGGDRGDTSLVEATVPDDVQVLPGLQTAEQFDDEGVVEFYRRVRLLPAEAPCGAHPRPVHRTIGVDAPVPFSTTRCGIDGTGEDGPRPGQ